MPRPNAIQPFLVVAACLTLAGHTSASERTIETWGKSGVDFRQYRIDAVECARHGYYRDVSHDEPAQRFLRGFETADRGLNDPAGLRPDVWRDSVLITQPDRKKSELHQIQVNDVEQCLTDKGYRRIRLTADQGRHLARLKPGSERRQRFLHRLSSKPVTTD